jgi:hypothetical protein
MLHVLKFDNSGLGHCLYTEILDLTSIGPLQIARASTIEFNNDSKVWEVKDSESRVLFSNPSRTVCLVWEQQYFNR